MDGLGITSRIEGLSGSPMVVNKVGIEVIKVNEFEGRALVR